MNNNRIYIINGPNMNLLGTRDNQIYGNKSLPEINTELAKIASNYSISCVFLQSNSEGDLISFIHEAANQAQGLIINPAAYAHYSYAIRDALEYAKIPKVEVHISNIMEREDFRKISVTAEVCDELIYGKLEQGYFDALNFIINKLDSKKY